MGQVLVGCGQLTWKDVPPDQVLAEIAETGYDGAPAGGRLGAAAAVRAPVARHRLRPAPGYLGADLWRPEELGSIVERARAQVAFSRDLGLTELYVAPSLTPERRAVAGRVGPADSLDESGYRQMAEALNRIGEVALAAGVRACFHNHVGSPVETRAEIDRLFALVDRSLVFQGPDLGHLAWAGDDPVQFCRDYADSILTLHVKDIDPRVLAAGRAEKWDYRGFSDHGIFAEIGEGMIDFPAVLAALGEFAGWLIVETDVTTKSSAKESATISRAYLRSVGV
jgi:inosose dehydratase